MLFTLAAWRLDGSIHQVLCLFGWASLIVLSSCLAARMICGASLFYLARTRFYEVPPIRLALHVLHWGSRLALLTAILIGLRYAWASYQSSFTQHLGVLLYTAAAGFVCFLLLLAFRRLVGIEDNRPPEVNVSNANITPGIAPRHFEFLGSEQFPQMLAFGHGAGLGVRRVLMLAGFFLPLAAIVALTEWGRGLGLHVVRDSLVQAGRTMSPPLPQAWAIVGIISGGLGLVMLLAENHTYTLMRFPATLIFKGALLTLVWVAAVNLNATPAALTLLAALLAFFLALRWLQDLNAASQFRGKRKVTLPIIERIAEALPDLNTLKTRPDCRLAPLSEDDLCQRLTKGCRNLEAAGTLVTRNVARFLSLVEVEYEHLTAASLRMMTVGRSVSTDSYGGTARGLRSPVVPVWDEVLFPLRPPSGFLTWTDPLPLGREWDIVSVCVGCGGSGMATCGSCGGSGNQQKTETSTVYNNGQQVTETRTINVTCSSCGGRGRVVCGGCSGMGRVEIHQTLNTLWQRELPTLTDTATRVPELMEDAEERTYFQFSLIENREWKPRHPRTFGIEADLAERLTNAVKQLAKSMAESVKAVEKLHGGRIYRADFQVAGFWAMRISFRLLPGKAGWFFGRRPEFYFPVLPLSWGMVGTILFVLPFLVLISLLAVTVCWDWLNRTLPSP